MTEDKNPRFNDMEQGVLFLSYSTPDSWNLLLEELKKRGVPCREIHLIDITIPCRDTKKYNETVNFLKSFSSTISDRLIEAIPNNFMAKQIIKKIENSTNYKLMRDKEKWETDNINPLLSTSMTPLAVEYKEQYKNRLDDPEAKKNYERLLKFESDGYKPKILRYDSDGKMTKDSTITFDDLDRKTKANYNENNEESRL